MMVVLMVLIMIVIWLTLINYLRQVVILRLLWLGWCGQTNQGLVCSGILSAWLDYHATRTERGGH